MWATIKALLGIGRSKRKKYSKKAKRGFFRRSPLRALIPSCAPAAAAAKSPISSAASIPSSSTSMLEGPITAPPVKVPMPFHAAKELDTAQIQADGMLVFSSNSFQSISNHPPAAAKLLRAAKVATYVQGKVSMKPQAPRRAVLEAMTPASARSAAAHNSTTTALTVLAALKKLTPRSDRMKQAHRARQLFCDIVIQDVLKLLKRHGTAAVNKQVVTGCLSEMLVASQHITGRLADRCLGMGGQGVVRLVTIKKKGFRLPLRTVCPRPVKVAKRVEPECHEFARKFMVFTLTKIEKLHKALDVKGLSMPLARAVEEIIEADPRCLFRAEPVPVQGAPGNTQSEDSVEEIDTTPHMLWVEDIHVIPVSDCRKALLTCLPKEDQAKCQMKGLESTPGVLVALDMERADTDLHRQLLIEHAYVSPDDKSVPHDMLRSLTGQPFGAHHVNVPALCDLVLQVYQGVAETEAYGLLHGDLKPANFMIMGKRANKYDAYQPGTLIVKLGDFGAATIQAQKAGDAVVRSKYAIVGTSAYQAAARIKRRALRDYTLYASDELDSMFIMCLEMILGCTSLDASLLIPCVALWMHLITPAQREAARRSSVYLCTREIETMQQASRYIPLLTLQVKLQGPAGGAYIALLGTLGHAILQHTDNHFSITAASIACQLQQLQEQVMVPLQQAGAAACMLLLPHADRGPLAVQKALLLPHVQQAAREREYMVRLCDLHPDALFVWVKRRELFRIHPDVPCPADMEKLVFQYGQWRASTMLPAIRLEAQQIEQLAEQQQQQQVVTESLAPVPGCGKYEDVPSVPVYVHTQSLWYTRCTSPVQDRPVPHSAMQLENKQQGEKQPEQQPDQQQQQVEPQGCEAAHASGSVPSQKAPKSGKQKMSRFKGWLKACMRP